MQHQLEKIEQWLQIIAAKIAEFSLQQAASKQQLQQFDMTIQKNIPPEFKTLYLWRNGMNEDENLGNLFYGMAFLSLDEIKSKRSEFEN